MILLKNESNLKWYSPLRIKKFIDKNNAKIISSKKEK
jgi:hypothetical protein